MFLKRSPAAEDREGRPRGTRALDRPQAAVTVGTAGETRRRGFAAPVPYLALQLRFRVSLIAGAPANSKLVRVSGKLAPGKPFGAGQPALT